MEKVPPHPQQRTKRYMAPEILDSSISAHSFSTYQQADMYALSLVMWELLRRCQVGGECSEAGDRLVFRGQEMGLCSEGRRSVSVRRQETKWSINVHVLLHTKALQVAPHYMHTCIVSPSTQTLITCPST